MARPLRIEYAGAVYHVMARGNQGQPIFRDDRDRRVWLATLAEAQVKTGWRIHACVLMGNHYHLLLETPEGNLVAGMKWLQGTCARWQKDAPEKVALAWWLRERTTDPSAGWPPAWGGGTIRGSRKRSAACGDSPDDVWGNSKKAWLNYRQRRENELLSFFKD